MKERLHAQKRKPRADCKRETGFPGFSHALTLQSHALILQCQAQEIFVSSTRYCSIKALIFLCHALDTRVSRRERFSESLC